MTEPKNKKSFTRTVYYSMCDTRAWLSPVATLSVIQDSATSMLSAMGCGNITLRNEYHSMWVFTGQRVRTYKRFFLGDEMHIESRCVNSGRARNFILTELRDKDGTLYTSSLVESCVLDIETFKIRPLDTIPFVPSDEKTDKGFDIPELTATERVGFTVLPLMTDYSKHFNNVQSLAVYINSFPEQQSIDIFPDRYEIAIKYHAQAKCGEKLNLIKGTTDSGNGYDITDSDGKLVIQARIKSL